MNSIGLYLLIAFIVVLAALFIWHYINVYKTQGKEAAMKELRELAYQLMLGAEKLFGRDMGKSKMEWCINQFYRQIAPGWLAKMLPENTVEEFLQKVYDDYYNKLKDYLDDGQVNGSILYGSPEPSPDVPAQQ
jgi:hypothetical protein